MYSLYLYFEDIADSFMPFRFVCLVFFLFGINEVICMLKSLTASTNKIIIHPITVIALARSCGARLICNYLSSHIFSAKMESNPATCELKPSFYFTFKRSFFCGINKILFGRVLLRQATLSFHRPTEK